MTKTVNTNWYLQFM